MSAQYWSTENCRCIRQDNQFKSKKSHSYHLMQYSLSISKQHTARNLEHFAPCFYINHPLTLALALTWLWVMANSSLNVNISIVVTFLAGLLLFVSKLKFVFKIFYSKAQVTVFNHSLALCLLASGDVVTKNRCKSTMSLFNLWQALALSFAFQLQYGFLISKGEAMKKNLSKMKPIYWPKS